ncbi:MAG TPA: RNA 3'-terminal phosphate cyclase [Nitrososphaerales archaeon]|nr:RNA 3'-terminal phosphate cyclase [Nitrososphaerales archaeon]
MDFIKIDGGFGEGGGQILRTSVALSAITRKPVEVFNIRAKRDNPGLRPQHVTAIKAVASLCNADVENVNVGSNMIRFSPKEMQSGSMKMDVGTAGSITMILQAVIPAVSLANKKADIELVGGTDVRWSPTFDYMRYVLRAAYKTLGINFDINVLKRGYYPVGGGVVKASIEPCNKLNALDMVSAPKIEPKMISVCSSLPKHVAERQIASALSRLQKENVKCNSYSASFEQSHSPGSSILIYSTSDYGPFIGGDSIGEKGKRSEEVGSEAADRFLDAYLSNAPIDPYLADMLVLPLCLADGRSKFAVNKATQHLSTNLYIASKIVSCSYEISKSDRNYVVIIEGKR